MRIILASVSLFTLATCGSANAMIDHGEPVEVSAPTGQYANDPTHTSLTWKIGHLGLSDYTARVSDVSISLDFDAENIAASSVTATIDPATFDTGYPGTDKDFDAEIASPMIMNAEAFPTITFSSTGITQTSPTTADIAGDLTLMGVTRPVTLQATYKGSTASHPFVQVPAIGFSARTVIDRTEFGSTFLSGSGLADEVEIIIQAEMIQQ